MTDETRAEGEGGTTATEQPVEAVEKPDAVVEKKEDGEEELPKLHQTVELKDVGPCKKHIKVIIERKDIDDRLNKEFSKLVHEANVPGFRPGKAPRKVIERKYAKDVTGQVRGEILLQSLEQLADEHDIAPLSAPDINPAMLEIPKEGPFIYEFEVEVRPEFDLPNYKGLKLRRPVKTFTDEDVAKEEERLLAPYGQLVPKPEGKAKIGDYLIADMTTRDGERVISELKEVKLRVEPRLIFKDAVAEKFGEQVQGASAGDKRTIDIGMLGTVAEESLKGKTIKAQLDVKEVKSLRLPELTHEFLHNFGVHSPDQLRERIRVLLERRLELTQRQAVRDQFIEQITAASSWELPPELLQRQARKALNRKILEMQSMGLSDEDIRARSRLLYQDVMKNTILGLKEHFVLQKIAEIEKIDVDEDDINAEIERMAAQSDESPRRVRARLEKDDLLETLAAEIIERKALDLILDTAEYEDVPLDQRQEETPTATVEEQAVPGEMKDPTAPPPAAEAKAEGVEEKKEEATK